MQHFFLLLFLSFSISAFTQLPFINEIDYHTTGSGSSATDGGVGVAGPSGLDLSDYSLRVYRNNGTLDASMLLTGLIVPNQSASNRGEIWVDVAQCFANNDPVNNGMFVQLVNETTSVVIETITFGGSDPGNLGGITPLFLGATDPANSHQLTGTGCNAIDFSWSNDQTPTPGAINTGQVFSGCSAAAILPVSLVEFSGKFSRGVHHIYWETAAEWNNSHFTLEVSSDARNFAPIVEIAARNRASEYQSVHEADVRNKIHYYRLSQTDLDGTTKRLGTISIATPAEVGPVVLAPNPVVDVLRIQSETSILRVDIFSAKGDLLLRSASQTEIQTETLPPGWYTARITLAGGQVIHRRFVR